MKGNTFGIVFDLDNTLLRSHIDFPGMKSEVARWLREHGALDPRTSLIHHTTSQLINLAKGKGLLSQQKEEEVWKLIGKFEEEGMRGAVLEEGAKEMLEKLHDSYILAVLTNNAYIAALHALQETEIASYFTYILGREQVLALKPSPLGLGAILHSYPEQSGDAWIMVGDSWIDGKAAQENGVPFLSYKGKEDDFFYHKIESVGRLTHLQDIFLYL